MGRSSPECLVTCACITASSRLLKLHQSQQWRLYLHTGTVRGRYLHTGTVSGRYKQTDTVRHRYFHTGTVRGSYLHTGTVRVQYLHTCTVTQPKSSLQSVFNRQTFGLSKNNFASRRKHFHLAVNALPNQPHFSPISRPLPLGSQLQSIQTLMKTMVQIRKI